MKAASIVLIRKELQHLSTEELRLACIRMAQHTKENKELLTYLLFEAQNEAAYIQKVQELLSEEFKNIDRGSRRLTKKRIRRILKSVKKYAKFSKNKETEIQLLLWFCKNLSISMREINFQDRMMDSLYDRQIDRVLSLMKGMHEDVQFDYQIALDKLKNRK